MPKRNCSKWNSGYLFVYWPEMNICGSKLVSK